MSSWSPTKIPCDESKNDDSRAAVSTPAESNRCARILDQPAADHENIEEKHSSPSVSNNPSTQGTAGSYGSRFCVEGGT